MNACWHESYYQLRETHQKVVDEVEILEDNGLTPDSRLLRLEEPLGQALQDLQDSLQNKFVFYKLASSVSQMGRFYTEKDPKRVLSLFKEFVRAQSDGTPGEIPLAIF